MSNRSVCPARSWLFTPATRPDRLLGAARSGVDVSISDLEDFVSPAEKPDARKSLLAVLNTPLDETMPGCVAIGTARRENSKMKKNPYVTNE